MSVSLPHPANLASPLPGSAASGRRANVIERITDWLKRAERRRADRAIAQYVCDCGIHHISDSVEREIAFRHTGAR